MVTEFIEEILKRILADMYRLIDKYMPQPHSLGSGVRLSSEHISRVWTIRKAK
jgi:hypothetical protein